jgi:parvulin-like peptidyl-prolyl isomerase
MHRHHSAQPISYLKALTWVAAVTAAALFLGCTEKEPPPPEPAVAAVVNGEKIFREELDREVRRLDKSFAVDTAGQDADRFAQEVLRQMIRRRLLRQEARKRGAMLTPEETRKIIAERTGEMTREQLDDIAHRAGMPYERWEQRMLEDPGTEKLVHQVIDPTLGVTEEELTAYYYEHPEEFRVRERVRVRQIMLAKYGEAAQARKRLTEGQEDFALVALEVSLSPDAADGGQIGVFQPGQMPPEFDLVCFSLEIGEISPIVKTPYGYHIFLVEERFPSGVLSFQEARDGIYNRLFAERREEAFVQFQQELWDRAEITLMTEQE